MRFPLLQLLAGAMLAQSPPDFRQLVDDSLRFVDPTRNKQPDYYYMVRSERRQFDANGKTRSDETTLATHTFQEGLPILRVLEKNGRKLTDAEGREQEAKISKRVADYRGLSLEEQRRKAAEGTEWIREIPDALDFTLVGEELLDGRQTLVLTCVPHPGYSPRNIRARVLEKMNGKLWVDKTEHELVRVDAETFDTVYVGFGLLGRIEKGTKFTLHRSRLPDGNWVIDSQQVHFGARIMLLKWIGNEITTKMYDFRHRTQLSAGR